MNVPLSCPLTLLSRVSGQVGRWQVGKCGWCVDLVGEVFKRSRTRENENQTNCREIYRMNKTAIRGRCRRQAEHLWYIWEKARETDTTSQWTFVSWLQLKEQTDVRLARMASVSVRSEKQRLWLPLLLSFAGNFTLAVNSCTKFLPPGKSDRNRNSNSLSILTLKSLISPCQEQPRFLNGHTQARLRSSLLQQISGNTVAGSRGSPSTGHAGCAFLMRK